MVSNTDTRQPPGNGYSDGNISQLNAVKIVNPEIAVSELAG
jgi:hypothetical protein